MIYWRQQKTITADKRKKPREQVKLDRIMRLLFHLSHKTVVLLVNGLFDEAFDPGQVKVVYGNGNMTGHDFSKLEADLLLKVETASGDCEYHIEFQTLHDSAMAVRMFRYGFNRALEAGRMAEAVEAGTLTLFFPRQLYTPGLNGEEAVRLASPSGVPLAQTAAGLGAEQIAGRRKAAADG